MSLLKGTFGFDKKFLEKHLSTLVLEDGDSRMIISPALQGRVVTSSSSGNDGRSYGWINYALIESGEFLPHCNNFGGEDRYWIGPEGGQFSIFFKNGSPFDLEHWQTPSPIDTDPWEVVSLNNKTAILARDMDLPNYTGNIFRVNAEREITLMDTETTQNELQFLLPGGVKSVSFKSVNRLTNKSDFEWNHNTGMLSIWILGQFIPSERNTVILPFNENVRGKIVNDTYFGKVEDDRIKILEKAVLFKGDGKKRGKIGIGPKKVKPVIGSYDPINKVLTIVKFSFDPAKKDYVNSMWEYQSQPFKGDVINSYNDGPLPDGTLMGPFYELETSSPAARLKPGESIIHEHATFHFEGNEESLDTIAQKTLGLSVYECF